MSEPLMFTGLDGGNPLAFLALLGLSFTSRRHCADGRISWVQSGGAWRPRLHNFDGYAEDFLIKLFESLKETSNAPFAMDTKLPFPREALRGAMQRFQVEANRESRREVDLLAGFGTDAHADEKGFFLDTSLRMVRSGDSAGQGLSAYALAIRRELTVDHLRAALFDTWRYADEAFSLRWDPIEDQRYALRWHDPSSQSNKKHSLRTMRGANALALEALSLLPVQPLAHGVATTGFVRLEGRRDSFTWPIWETPIDAGVIRSLMAMPELADKEPPREKLRARGIVEVYRSERIAANQYYKNFTPAHPA